MRAVVYLRNSSGKQATAGTDEGQLQQAHVTAARLGADVVAVYADRGISAKSGNLGARGDFARLVADLPAQRPDLCIVANVDRLTRSELFTELGKVWGPLQEAGVRVATAGGQVLDLNTPDGQLMAFLESYRSARENAARSERTLAGRVRAAREGRNPGRPPYGYRWTREAGWSAPGAAVVLEVYQRSAAGESCNTIAAALNRRGVKSANRGGFTDSTIVEVIRPKRPSGDPYVTGLWIGQRGEAPIPVPSMVPAELAARARAALASRAHAPPTHARHVNYLDDNALSCGVCGAPVRVASSKGRLRKDGTRARFAYYICDRRRQRGHGGDPCTLPPVPVGELDARAWALLVESIDAPVYVGSAANEDADQARDAAADLAAARERLAGDAARLDALAEALGDGALSAESYRAQVARIVARRDLLAQQVTTWEAAREPSGVSAGAVAALRMELRALLAGASSESRRALLRRCCPSWVYDGAELQVVRVGGGVGPLMRMPMRIAV